MGALATVMHSPTFPPPIFPIQEKKLHCCSPQWWSTGIESSHPTDMEEKKKKKKKRRRGRRRRSVKKTLSHFLHTAFCKLTFSGVPDDVLEPSFIDVRCVLDELDHRLRLRLQGHPVDLPTCHPTRPDLPTTKRSSRGRKGKKTNRLISNAYASFDVFSSGGDDKPHSFSSDSSEICYSSMCKNKKNNGGGRGGRKRRSGGGGRRWSSLDGGFRPLVEKEDKVDGGSVAVVKRSRDPYGDFRSSMLEMIMERQIFGDKELEGLLSRYLSLNDSKHHALIVKVFSEIRHALFGDS